MTNKAGGCHRTLSIFSLIVAVFAVAAWAGLQHPLAQRFFMRFFRDVSRARSYARLHASSTALALAFGGDDEERLRFQLRAPGNGGSLSSAADPRYDVHKSNQRIFRIRK